MTSRTLWRVVFLVLALLVAPTVGAAPVSPLAAKLRAMSAQELIEAFRAEPHWYFRIEIAKEMARRWEPAFEQPALELLAREQDRSERCIAGYVLARAGRDKGVELVLEELRAALGERERYEKDTLDRQHELDRLYLEIHFVQLTLGLIGDARAVPALVEILRSEPSSSRAALSLGEIGDRSAIPALREYVERGGPDGKLWGGYALAQLGQKQGLELLTGVAVSAQMWTDRRHAIDALVELGGRRFLPTVIKALGDADVHVRFRAAKLLGELGDPAALPALRKALDDHEMTTENEPGTVSRAAEAAIEAILGGSGR